MMRSSRREPAQGLKRDALRLALPFDGFCNHAWPARCAVAHHQVVALSIAKPACKQLSYRLRHQPLSTVDTNILRKQLQRKRLLVAHTVYECSSCGERLLGERRCPECHLYGRSVGLGGSCPYCETVILLADLLELEETAPS
jgi:ribosomal protein L32